MSSELMGAQEIENPLRTVLRIIAFCFVESSCLLPRVTQSKMLDGSRSPDTSSLKRRNLPLDLSLNVPESPQRTGMKRRRCRRYHFTVWLLILLGCVLYVANQRLMIQDVASSQFETSFLLKFANVTPMIRDRTSSHSKPMILHVQLDNLYSKFSNSSENPDFGGLNIRNRTRFDDPIEILSGYFETAARLREEFLNAIDETDDQWQPESSKEDENPTCRRVSWTQYTFPNCNQVHENNMERIVDDNDGYAVWYVSSGTYRDAFWIRKITHPSSVFVMKQMMIHVPVEPKTIEMTRKEALILERLTASPRILNTYGLCGVAVLVEAMAEELNQHIVLEDDGTASQKELDALDDVYPQNNLTTSEKLELAIEMAKALADLHGFDGGPIIHADTHIEQWLIAPDGSIKLNDFNLAFEPQWDAEKGAYCDKWGVWEGTHRSPEEYNSGPQDEKVDIYEYGQNIYSMLTGLWPFYDEEYHGINSEKTRDEIVEGKTPFVDPRYRNRSFIEGKLVEIMERCWVYDRTKRPSIFEVVSFLSETKLEAMKRGEVTIHSSDIIKIRLPDVTK